VKNEKEMATNFYFKMTMVEDKMADPFFSKQKDEKKWFQRCPKETIFDTLYPVSHYINSLNV